MATTRVAPATRASASKKFDWLIVLDVAAAVAMMAMLWFALVYAREAVNLPTETERLAQRIFYPHLGVAAAAGLGFALALLASLIYLIRRTAFWDHIASASVEIGLLFGTLVLVTGSIWAKPTWGVWWTWDPRLTTATITWLIYLAYLMLRGAVEDPERCARFSAVYAIVGFVSVPITYFSIYWWRTIHPAVFGQASPDAQGGFGVGETMVHALQVSLLAFTLLFFALLAHRVRQKRMEEEIYRLQETVSR